MLPRVTTLLRNSADDSQRSHDIAHALAAEGQTFSINDASLAALNGLPIQAVAPCRCAMEVISNSFEAGDDDYRRTRVATSKGFQNRDAVNARIEINDHEVDVA